MWQLALMLLLIKNVAEENIAVAGVPAHKVSNGGGLNWNKNKLI